MKRLIGYLLIGLIGIAAGWYGAGRQPAPISHVDVLTIDRVRGLAELTTLEADVAEVKESSLQGYIGGIRAVLIVKGEVRIGTDLGKARLISIDQVHRTAVLVLDPPKVSTARLDHEQTRLFAVSEQGLWLITPGDWAYTRVVNKAFVEAQRAIAEAGDRPELLAKARRQAEGIMQGFCDALGWRITVTWSNEGAN